MKTRVLCIIALTIGLVSCASLSAKQTVSAIHQTARQALVAVDEAERDVCRPEPTNPAHCTAVPVVIKDGDHQRVSAYLAQAFEQDARVSAAIIAWKPGQPVPADLPALLLTAQQVLSTINALVPSTQTTVLLSKVQEFLAKLEELRKKFLGGAA